MDIKERKAKAYEQLAALKEEIKILNANIAEFEKVLEKINTEEDLEKYSDNDFDIEKGLNIIQLF